MRAEPELKRAMVFFDGQNLFHHAKEAFGYRHPNYDPRKLAQTVCDSKGWQLHGVHFYTGVPDVSDNPFWNHFWTAKLAVMGTRDVRTYSRSLRYRNQTVTLPGGGTTVTLVGQEKGIDIRIALDVVRLALEGSYDVAVIFSQDQDLSEAVEDVKRISLKDDRWIKVVCAFPSSPTVLRARGINGTDWFRIERTLYDQCIDPGDYRPKGQQ